MNVTATSYHPSVISANVISIIGFGISTLLLCTHLIVYLITEDMRTLIGNSLASFCLSLLLSYCAYIGGMLVHDTSLPCVIVALFAFYSFLANSSWLLSISLQLYNAVSNGANFHDSRTACRFVLYSAFSWLQPALFLGAALFAQTYNGDFHLLFKMPKNLRVDFFPLGTNCFNRNTSVLIWFLVLFNINLTITFTISAFTACVAGRKDNRQRRIVREEGTVYTDDDDVASKDQLFTLLRYYMRLSLFVGFVWIVGMAMIYFKAHLLQIVFAISNAALALYIFIVFTFNNKLYSVVFNEQCKSYNMDTIVGVRHDRRLSVEHGSQNATDPAVISHI